MADDNSGCYNFVAFIAFAAIAVTCGFTVKMYFQLCDVQNKVDGLQWGTPIPLQEGPYGGESLNLIKKRVALSQHDHTKLLSETRAMNKTVEQALDELKYVKDVIKESYGVIQNKLQALFHFHDIAKDFLNLRQDFKNLTEVVNQIMAHVDKNLEENRREWEKLIANEKSDT
jgi:hypothetical protein